MTSQLDDVILDLNLTCPHCGYQIQPTEIAKLDPKALRCPKCQQLFSPRSYAGRIEQKIELA
jgi:DNA-directed RNA polymerase subunit RPC12/RpoP